MYTIAVNPYHCWLQAGFKPDIPPHLFSGLYAESGTPVLSQAAAELTEGLSRRFGTALPRTDNAGGGAGAGASPTFFLGTAAFLRDSSSETASFTVPNLPPEGFWIQITEPRVVIAGADGPGTLYGVFRFLSLLARGRLTVGTEITDAPGAAFRALNHWDNIEGTIERGYAGPSVFFKDGEVDFSPERLTDYARLMASVGLNILSINNVNVRTSTKLISAAYLPRVAAIANIFRPFGIRLMLSVNFTAPERIGGLDTSDPLDPRVAAWWQQQTALVYRHIPDLAGYLIKADSEGEGGPFRYGRTHADGANMLGKALLPFGGRCIWRCFVYNCTQDWRDTSFDRASAAYDIFQPLDGAFDDNVALQIKFGPYDFQVREPVSPLFGALKKTRCIMELQVTQEYTGQQIDLCFLPWMWQDVMAYDTGHGATIQEMLIRRTRGGEAAVSGTLEGLSAIPNIGLDLNWTGHTLAQANLYGYGRLCWNPGISAAEIAAEWSVLSFGPGPAADTVRDMLLASYPAYQKYTAPFGVCFMCKPNHHYGPSVEGYEFDRWGTYHRANREAVGVDRTKTGTGYTAQYPPAIAALYDDPKRCPDEALLFIHRLRYDFVMKNGKTLLQNIYDTHFEGYAEAEAIAAKWKTLQGTLPPDVYEPVAERLLRQLENAREWRDQVNTYFFRHTLIPDDQGRTIYP